jgi:serine/threonine-protein kinase
VPPTPSPAAPAEPLRVEERPPGAAPGADAGPAPSDPRGPLPVGTELDGGRYRLGEPLGRGGFAITYDAVDVRLDRTVAIKELFPASARRDGRTVVVGGDDAPAFGRARDRFLREATTLARFAHPSIVRIYAVFEERGTAYIVLERIGGRTLAAELAARRGPMTEAEALDVATQLAGALDTIHRAGVLHRDVSPSNLIRADDGRVVLIDFGLARPFDDHTMTMTRIVTPGYAPPEQHAGEAHFTPRADVYAVGATLHRLLSGEVPPASTRRVAGGVDITPLWRVNPTVSRRVSDAVTAALALDPEDRPASVAALLARLGVDPAEAGLSVAAVPVVVAAGDPVTEVDRGADGWVDAGGDERTDDLSWRPSLIVARPSRPASEPTGAPLAATAPVAQVAPVAPAAQVAPAAPAAPVVHPWSRPGRRWVTWPLGLAAVSLASCQPVGVTLALGLGIGPALATAGDLLLRRDRHPAWAAWWWARNVLTGAARLVGPLLVLAIGLAAWWVTDTVSFLSGAAPWVLRVTGGLCGWMVASSFGRGSPRFRTDVALDALTVRLAPRGRPSLQGVVLLLVCAAMVAAGLWFEPEAWPLAG